MFTTCREDKTSKKLIHFSSHELFKSVIIILIALVFLTFLTAFHVIGLRL